MSGAVSVDNVFQSKVFLNLLPDTIYESVESSFLNLLPFR